MQSGEMRWASYGESVGKAEIQQVLVGYPEEKCPFGRSWRRWDNKNTR